MLRFFLIFFLPFKKNLNNNHLLNMSSMQRYFLLCVPVFPDLADKHYGSSVQVRRGQSVHLWTQQGCDLGSSQGSHTLNCSSSLQIQMKRNILETCLISPNLGMYLFLFSLSIEIMPLKMKM